MPLNRDLKAKLEQANEHYEALIQGEQNRATYLLTSMIVDIQEPEKSIADLERLGEEKLRQIAQWLVEAKPTDDEF